MTTDAEVTDDLVTLVERGWLTGDALVVVERATRGAPLAWPAGLVADRERRYGAGTLWYGRPAPGGGAG
jgi:16S rRNA (guanine966-N2)-methyltransferase